MFDKISYNVKVLNREYNDMEHMELQAVTIDDMDLIYQWVNEIECRKNSFQTDKIPYEEHVKWFQSKLESSHCDMFLCYKDGLPIGQIRLDYDGEQAYISYSVAKEERGKGYGTLLLRLVEQRMQKEVGKVSILLAKVKKENIASQKKFEQLGYKKTGKESYILYTKEI